MTVSPDSEVTDSLSYRKALVELVGRDLAVGLYTKIRPTTRLLVGPWHSGLPC